ncbi:MAG: Ig-like domain-containing protein [Candidatus Kapaibacterium sp.]
MKFIKITLIILAALAGCANPQPPSGGPPDTTPPVVIAHNPAAGTRNFAGESITIEFSEWVDKNSVIENLHVQPEIKTDYDWSGPELEIEFMEPLAENTTYLVMIGGGYKDLHNNNPTEGFAITFSTGDKLDSGRISGNLFGDEKNGAFVFAYKIDAMNADTLNPITTPPGYFVKCGSSGQFELLALKDGTYRLIALTDRFLNRVFDPGQDAFGAAPRDVEVVDGKSEPIDIKLGPSPDIYGPLLFEVTGISLRSAEAMFSENLSPASIRPESFSARDSLGRDYAIAGAMPHIEPNKAIIFFKSELPRDIPIFLSAAYSGEYAIRDSAGNALQDTAATARFIAAESADTSRPAITRSFPADSATNLIPGDSIILYYSMPVEIAADTLATLYNESASFYHPVDWDMTSGNIINIRPRGKLDFNSWYRLEYRPGAVDGIFGRQPRDSIFELKFRTVDNRSWGSASGMVRDSSLDCGNLMLALIDAKGKRYIYKPDSTGAWKAPNLPEGTYTFEAFCDENGKGSYDYGYPAPFRHAEPFRRIGREISIRSRWEVEDILIIIK